MHRAVIAVALLSASVLVFCAPAPAGQKRKAEIVLHRPNHSLALPLKDVFQIQPKFFHDYLRPRRVAEPRFWVIVFYTRWCTVCDEISDPLGTAATNLASLKAQVSFGKVDVSDDEGPAHKYGIEGYPTIVLFGKDSLGVKSRFEGERTSSSIVSWIEQETGLSVVL